MTKPKRLTLPQLCMLLELRACDGTGAKAMSHCWKDRREHITETHGYLSEQWAETYHDGWCDGTCMLEDGHDGPHEFTNDDEIGISFSEAPS